MHSLLNGVKRIYVSFAILLVNIKSLVLSTIMKIAFINHSDTYFMCTTFFNIPKTRILTCSKQSPVVRNMSHLKFK